MNKCQLRDVELRGVAAALISVVAAASLAAQEPAPFTMPIPPAAHLVAITNGTILTVTHGTIPHGTIVIRDGKIAAVGADVAVPAGAQVIDATGRYVMPGIIDEHSHAALEVVNEISNAIDPEVRMADAVRQDMPTIYWQLAGGVTMIHTLHGSANAIGGQNVLLKLRWGLPVDSLIVQGAPASIKFALGENPKESNFQALPGHPRYPQTRMGVEELIRDAFTRAVAYRTEWQQYEAARRALKRGQPEPIPPRRDLQLDALVEIMDGRRLVHSHAYRADEMLMLLRVARDFGFRVASFEHVLEGYKIADEIAAAGTGASIFADFWGYKLEAYDAIPYDAALLTQRGVVVAVNSDDNERARRLYQEAAKTMHFGGVSETDALKMVTLNPARMLGIENRVGSIDVGKDADLAIFSGHPFAPAARVEMTLVDGRVFFDRTTAPTLDYLMQQLKEQREHGGPARAERGQQ
jgi:imidazolonepropionase-like amidohydrolase